MNYFSVNHRILSPLLLRAGATVIDRTPSGSTNLAYGTIKSIVTSAAETKVIKRQGMTRDR